MMPFHEFAKSAILGSRRYFKMSVSRVVNVFAPSTARGASHWTICRILARLLSSQHSQSALGEGFIATNDLIREYRESFGFAEDFVACCARLLIAGLVESEPPRVKKLGQTEAIRISAAGAYHWSYLVRSFAYVDLVLVDTPLADEALAKELATLSEKRKEDYSLSEFVTIRIARVRKFLAHVCAADASEIAQAAMQGGPYKSRLSDVLVEQLEREIQVIKRKTGAKG